MQQRTHTDSESKASVALTVHEYTKIKTTQENHEQRIRVLEQKAQNDIETLQMNARTVRGTLYGALATALLGVVAWLINKSMGS